MIESEKASIDSNTFNKMNNTSLLGKTPIIVDTFLKWTAVVVYTWNKESVLMLNNAAFLLFVSAVGINGKVVVI